ncbi:MAG: HAMP domain-containing sensor histidine kinase [Pirellulales bacterium]
MLSKWPIRFKLTMGLCLLVVMVLTLAGSGAFGLYAYRGLVKSLSYRSREMPLATELIEHVSNMRVALSQVRGLNEFAFTPSAPAGTDRFELRDRFQRSLGDFKDTLKNYRDKLNSSERPSDHGITDEHGERRTLARIDGTLARIERLDQHHEWVMDELKVSDLTTEIDNLQTLVIYLPRHLYIQLQELATEVKQQYRTAIVMMWSAAGAALIMLGGFVRMFYTWVFRPLRVLIDGSRRVAQGQFNHRIELETHDEMSELSEAMNDMTARFRDIRDDLDRQVQIRTRQVVRSEQMASVGFLAAGVAHEINNPLASIALCAESLESRVSGLMQEEGDEPAIVRNYLRMIQEEAFRCKQITEKLLDFSRTGDVQRHTTELRELVESVIEMVGHLGRYRGKQVELLSGGPVYSRVNPQEIKQVVLNLITNGLDSLEPGGAVRVEVRGDRQAAKIIVTDDGCGMTAEVLEHLFEPFFTRRREGQGTGLGLSITYRIVEDHQGEIEATSDGPDRGSRFVVSLPPVDSPPDDSAHLLIAGCHEQTSHVSR